MEGEQAARRKQPLKRDEIQIAKQGRIEDFANQFALSWALFIENIEMKQMQHRPPRPLESPKDLASKFVNEQYPSDLLLHQGVCKFAAIQLAAQPLIRNTMKENIRNNAVISCTPTEQGKKDLDLFHPSYRVKRVQNLPLQTLRAHSDLYLDVLQCEKAGLVAVEIALDRVKARNFKNFLKSLYMEEQEDAGDSWNILRAEIIDLLVDKLLTREVIAEMREEIKEEAEAFVIAKCKLAFRALLMTGPFTTRELGMGDDYARQSDDGPRRGLSHNIIKDRDRICVLGAIMHQIDANNYVVTVAVVDKYGELKATSDFMRLLPPRANKRAQQQAQDAAMDGRPQPKSDEEAQHEKDKANLVSLLEKFSVDLIVVAANCLEARNLKDCLKKIAEDLKDKVIPEEEDTRARR